MEVVTWFFSHGFLFQHLTQDPSIFLSGGVLLDDFLPVKVEPSTSKKKLSPVKSEPVSPVIRSIPEPTELTHAPTPTPQPADGVEQVAGVRRNVEECRFEVDVQGSLITKTFYINDNDARLSKNTFPVNPTFLKLTWKWR